MEQLKERLRGLVFSREEGTVNELRALLRKELVKHLHSVDPKSVYREAGATGEFHARFPIQATNWLVAEHLRRNQYEFTFSVFILESGLEWKAQALSIADVLIYLGIDVSSAVAKSIIAEFADPNFRQVIWTLLSKLQCTNGPDNRATCDQKSADEPVFQNAALPSSVLLQDRLLQLDDAYAQKKLRLRGEEIGEDVLKSSSKEAYSSGKNVISATNVIAHRTPNDQMGYGVIEQEAILRYQQRLDSLGKDFEEQLQRKLEVLLCNKHNSENILEQHKVQRESLEKMEANYKQCISMQKVRIANEEREKYEMDYRKLKDEEAKLKFLLESVQERERILNGKESEHQRKSAGLANLKLELVETKRALNMAQAENMALSQNADTLQTNKELRTEINKMRLTIQHISSMREVEASRHSAMVGDLMTNLEKRLSQICTLQADLLQMEEAHNKAKHHISLENTRLKALVEAGDEKLKDSTARALLQHQQIVALNETMNLLHAQQTRVSSAPVKRNEGGHGEPVFPPVMESRINDKPFNSTIADRGVDLHGTYFDTSFGATQLPEELKLGLSTFGNWSYDDISCFKEYGASGSTVGELHMARDRIRALELEAKILEEKCYAAKSRVYSACESQIPSPLKAEYYHNLERDKDNLNPYEDTLPMLGDLSSLVRVSSSTPRLFRPQAQSNSRNSRTQPRRWSSLTFCDNQDVKLSGNPRSNEEPVRFLECELPKVEREDNLEVPIEIASQKEIMVGTTSDRLPDISLQEDDRISPVHCAKVVAELHHTNSIGDLSISDQKLVSETNEEESRFVVPMVAEKNISRLNNPMMPSLDSLDNDHSLDLVNETASVGPPVSDPLVKESEYASKEVLRFGEALDEPEETFRTKILNNFSNSLEKNKTVDGNLAELTNAPKIGIAKVDEALALHEIFYLHSANDELQEKNDVPNKMTNFDRSDIHEYFQPIDRPLELHKTDGNSWVGLETGPNTEDEYQKKQPAPEFTADDMEAYNSEGHVSYGNPSNGSDHSSFEW